MNSHHNPHTRIEQKHKLFHRGLFFFSCIPLLVIHRFARSASMKYCCLCVEHMLAVIIPSSYKVNFGAIKCHRPRSHFSEQGHSCRCVASGSGEGLAWLMRECDESSRLESPRWPHRTERGDVANCLRRVLR